MFALNAKNPRLLPVVGVLVLAVAIVVVLFSGTSGLTKESVDRHLQNFAGYISREAALAGKDAKLTYGTPEVDGWGFNKHATVANVGLELAEKSSPDTTKWSFSTAQMLVTLDPASAGGLLFAFPGPINVAEGGQPKTIITFLSPLKYAYSGAEGNSRAIAQTLYLPSQITLTAVGGDNGRVVISYDDNPLFREKFLPESNQREATYEFHNVKIVTADGMQVTAASVASRFNEAPGQDNRLAGKYTLAVSGLVIRDHDKVSKAYAMNVDLASSRDLPGANPATPAQTIINDMLLATDDFKVKVTGGVSTSPDDSMPSGNAAIDIDNVPGFLASELMPEQARKAISVALQKITGQPVEALAHATIPLKREKNGALYVGDTTFAALATSVLADMMQAAAPTAPAPAAPATPAPVAPEPEAPKSPAPNSM